MITKRQATLATLLYADIFDYPLTRSDLATWSVKRKESSLPKEAGKKGQFVFLPGRAKLVPIRMRREQAAIEKWTIAQKAGTMLRYIPTIQLVGVTGGLAMDNAKEHDDIDFFFIVSNGSLWISRLLAIVTIELLGRRRRRGAIKVKDMICLNMFMTRASLAIPKAEHDLYVAHEVLQMKPLWERGGVYGLFLRQNSWVKRFLPNAWHKKCRIQNAEFRMKENTSIFTIQLLKFMEPLARMIQLWYMKKHRTTEVIGDMMLRFHPKDARVWVKRALLSRLARYNIPLDNIFYDR